MSINIADVNPGDELTVKIGRSGEPEYWATLTGKVWRTPSGCLELGSVLIRDSNGDFMGRVHEIVSHIPAKPTEPQNIGAAVEDTDGQIWVRAAWGSGYSAWRNTKPEGPGVCNWRRYDEIDVVKVLHEGWPA